MDRATTAFWQGSVRTGLAAAAEVIDYVTAMEERVKTLEETVALLSQIMNVMMEER